MMKYSQQDMLNAIQEIKRGNSVKSTAKKYNIPRVTLMYKVKGKLPVGKRMGPKSIFPPEQEYFSRMGNIHDKGWFSLDKRYIYNYCFQTCP